MTDETPPADLSGEPASTVPAWVVMTPKDLARVGLLVATRGVWGGTRLISDMPLLAGHGGFANHACLMAADPDTYVAIAKIDWLATDGTKKLTPDEVNEFICDQEPPAAAM